jgi:hypothetical protein
MKLRAAAAALSLIFLFTASAWSDPMQDLIDTLEQDFERMVPGPNSSVGTDYPTRQAALGALYTNRSLSLIYEQNRELLSKQEDLLDRYDRIIDQNQKIIDLLTIISERVTPAVAAPPRAPGSGYSP